MHFAFEKVQIQSDRNHFCCCTITDIQLRHGRLPGISKTGDGYFIMDITAKFSQKLLFWGKLCISTFLHWRYRDKDFASISVAMSGRYRMLVSMDTLPSINTYPLEHVHDSDKYITLMYKHISIYNTAHWLGFNCLTKYIWYISQYSNDQTRE